MVRKLDFTLKPESPDLLHLDMLRIVASFGIVLLHFRTSIFAGCDDCSVLARNLDALSLFVDLFFVISGIVIAHVYGDRIGSVAAYRNFLVKRIARLGPVHWMTLLFFVAVGVLAKIFAVEMDRADKYDYGCLAQNAALIHAWGTCSGASFNTVSWSISAEMGMYLLFPLLYVAVTRRPWAMVFALLALVVVLYALFDSPAQRWYQWTYHFGVVRALPAFLLGLLVYCHRHLLLRVPVPNALMHVLMAAFVGGAITGIDQSILLIIVYLIPIAAFAADRQQCDSLLARKLGPFGQLTYSMYMLHPIVQSLGITLLGEMVLNLRGEQLGVWALICLVLAGPVAYLSLVLFERPARHWLGSWGRRSSELPKAVSFPRQR